MNLEPVLPSGRASRCVPPVQDAPLPLGPLIDFIRERHRQRDDLLRAEGDLTRRIKAICRRSVGYGTFLPAAEAKPRMAEAKALYEAIEKGEATTIAIVAMPLISARETISENLRHIERDLVKAVKQLPVYETFVVPINGFGAIGLAQIVGEAGDLGEYANPAKLWKRMGVGLVGDERQRKHTDKEKAAAHGYSPKRRSVMFVIGDSLLKKQNAYKDLYDARKVYEIQKAEAAGLTVVPAAKIPKGKEALYRSQGHVHNRSKRYAEKRLLRDLWRAWRGQNGDPEPAIH